MYLTSYYSYNRKVKYFVILTSICTIIFILNLMDNFNIIASFKESENKQEINDKIIKSKAYYVDKLSETRKSISEFNIENTNRNPTNNVKILSWTKYYGQRLSEAGKSMSELGCSDLNHMCTFSDRRDTVNTSDVILFHWRDLNAVDLPKIRLDSQIWLLYNWETPCHTRKLLENDLWFNWTTTYRLDSTLVGPTSSIAQRDINELTLRYEPNIRAKTKLVAWIVSNCKTISNREGYVSALQEFISVDIYGRCGKLKCKSSSVDDCYHQIAVEYKFYLSFENSICKDYVTEKLWVALDKDIIPIVFGGADYENLLPKNSYIDALKYTPKQLAKYLQELDGNETMYKSYFQWKSTQFLNSISGFAKYICIVCDAIIKWRHRGRPAMSQSAKYINKWYFDDAKCRSWQSDAQICVD